MEPIRILKNEKVLAEHTTASPMSHYGQPVWVVYNDDPEPGKALWVQGDNKVVIEIVCTKGGWLIVRQPDGLLAGIIWSDGNYYANLLLDQQNQPCKDIKAGNHIKGTIVMDPEDPDDIGAILH